jgi:F0F1-type ATP synthase delta subunit
MYLDKMTPKESLISYGNLGVKGSMGYKIIPSVNGQNYNHCISSHASSIIKYELNGKYNSFHSYIALNDSSSENASVEYQVICDGELKYISSKVKKFDKLRSVNVDISGTNILELRCFNFGDPVSHSLWIDPICDEEKINHHLGPFNNTYIDLDFEKIKSKYASIVFASENMANYLYAFLKTFQKNSNLKDCVNYIVITEESFIIRKIAKHFNAVVLKSNKTNNYMVKSPVDLKDSTYTIAKHIDAEYFVISDIDILVNKDLTEAFIENKIGICRDSNTDENTFGELVSSNFSAYRGDEKTIHLLKINEFENDHKDILNCGFITGPKKQLMILEDELKKLLPNSQFYLCFNNGAGVREQALINLALIRINNYQILDYSFNQQLLYLPVVENACLHLNALETKKIYSYLVAKECDDAFETINKNLFEDFIEINKFKNILCIGDLNFENKILNDDWIGLKDLSKTINKFDCVVYDHFDDLLNTKIKLYLINKILNEGKVVVLTAKENLDIFNLLDIDYELLGTDFGREILVIEK